MRAPRWAPAACVVLAGCVAPAVDTGAYQHNAVGALESAVSTARVAALALDARVHDRITLAYADTVVTESEEALDPIAASFAVVDPPGRDVDPLRGTVLDLLSEAGDLLADARIAVRREDVGAMGDLADQLRDVADDMEQQAETLP
ncbi:hypothetical protein OO014_07080 [Intrasporangium calvum]|uniref:Lipoprotein n=1 Tax=Intrasporangium calvum TaxID=53358 RepID=A0ABT5GFI9_9MICO|nr:hypothetical protein [Intrasporangium calvum]MDC5697018.1 hypothetical protein [Intrasporangium calvum]